jgi:hypothetical protein
MDLGGATCMSLGYGGGSLACEPWCNLNTALCTTCGSDPHIAACRELDRNPEQTTALALAADDLLVGVAWISSTFDGTSSLHFDRFNHDLMPLDPQPSICIPPANARQVGLSTIPGGFLLAAEGAGGINVQRYTADGLPLGAAGLHTGLTLPMLVSRPNNGPLLLASEPRGAVHAILLDDTGATIYDVVVFTAVTEMQYGSGVFIGDAFLVAMRSSIGGVQVTRIDLAGMIGSFNTPGSTSTEYPQLAWTGSEGRLTWNDFATTPTILWARIDAMGAPIGSALNIGMAPTYYDPAPLVTIGEDSVILMPGYSGQTGGATHLDYMRLTQAGVTSVGPARLNQDPELAMQYRIARGGADLFAAWVAVGVPGRVVVERISP